MIEPLLGDDCHVIANTAWRNPPEFGGGPGTATPVRTSRGPSVPWDDRIPYPVFAIGAHILPAGLHARPTARPRSCPGAIAPAGSRRSIACTTTTSPTTAGRPCCSTARAGDVALFVSDVLAPRAPGRRGGRGRYFLQVHYGRRDLAQRIRTTDVVNHLSPGSDRTRRHRTGALARRPPRPVLLRRVTRAMTDVLVRPEREADFDAISEVIRLAFRSHVEERIVRDIRASDYYIPGLALVATVG